jgi:signal transduction histidine kinase
VPERSASGPAAFARRWLWLCAALWWGLPGDAQAQRALLLVDAMHGVPLARHATFLEDPRGELNIEQVSSGAGPALFRPSDSDQPSFGFSDSAHWVRLVIDNPSSEPRTWLLELGYPQLDHVTLFVPDGRGGYQARVTGDMVPFGQRDVEYRNFLFRLRAEPFQSQTYYLRARSNGSVNLPLFAWSYEELLKHQGDDAAFLWLFYGALLAMAIYNTLVVLLTGQREHLYYVLLVFTIGCWQFTIDGQTFQYLLPNQCWLANRLVLMTIAIGLIWAALFARHLLSQRVAPAPILTRVTNAWMVLSVIVTGCTLLLPYRYAALSVLIATAALAMSAPLLIRSMGKVLPDLGRLFLLSWQGIALGIMISALRFANLLPPNPLFKWAIPFGGILTVTFLSLALAQRMNLMRDNVSRLNTQLLQNVADLKHALARAEQATRAKSEFLATMSHELRTPLNAIINIPQGLVEQFVAARFASCSKCGGYFELEPQERLGAETCCAACGAQGSLVEEDGLSYAAKPSDTVRFLRKIERAGRNLLKMVNAVLDYSKLEAGKFQLQIGELDLNQLIDEVMDEMSDLAEHSGVRLCASPCPGPRKTAADALRLRQVLVNLVGNAIKFSDGRGTVTIGCTAGESVDVLWVRDEGIGIAAEDLERIFAGFVQVFSGDTRKYGGTGLGLSISRSLVRMHGGELWVESAPGKGSTFQFSVPRPTELSSPVAKAS